MNSKGISALAKLGLTPEDIREVVEMICRRVKTNLYSDEVLRYIDDIKLQLNG